jgi:hypothetical protein
MYFIRSFFILLILVFASQANAANILLLHADGWFHTEVIASLEADGHTVTVGAFYDYNGTNPPLAGFDSVLHWVGYSYEKDMVTAGEQAIVDFVSNGGTLVVTHWFLHSNNDPLIEAILPVVGDSYKYDGTITVTDSGHPLTAGVASSWMQGFGTVDTYNGFTTGTLKPSATSVATIARGVDSGPMLSHMPHGNGIAMYFGSDLGGYYGEEYLSNEPNPNSLQLLSNALSFTGAPIAPATPIPAMSVWGLGIFVALLGLIGFSRRRYI